MSLTTSSKGFSSSPLGVSDFFSCCLAGLGRGSDASRSPPFWARASPHRARVAINRKAKVFSSIVRFMALRKVEDACLMLPNPGQTWGLLEISGNRSFRENALTVVLRRRFVHNFGLRECPGWTGVAHCRCRARKNSYGASNASGSGKDFGDDFAAVDGGTLVAAVVKEGQLLVLHAQQAQNRRVDVVDVRIAFHRPQTDFICCAVGCAGFDPSARHPHRETPRIMVAAFAFFVERRPAKLARPDHEGVVEQAARFQ